MFGRPAWRTSVVRNFAGGAIQRAAARCGAMRRRDAARCGAMRRRDSELMGRRAAAISGPATISYDFRSAASTSRGR
jgi:hypothetical protein